MGVASARMLLILVCCILLLCYVCVCVFFSFFIHKSNIIKIQLCPLSLSLFHSIRLFSRLLMLWLHLFIDYDCERYFRRCINVCVSITFPSKIHTKTTIIIICIAFLFYEFCYFVRLIQWNEYKSISVCINTEKVKEKKKKLSVIWLLLLLFFCF